MLIDASIATPTSTPQDNDRGVPKQLIRRAAKSGDLERIRVRHFCCRIATRYDKLAAHFAFVELAPIRLWLHVYEFTA
jgi:hypothetical protein